MELKNNMLTRLHSFDFPKDLFSSNFCKLKNCAKKGCKNPEHDELRLFGEGMMMPGQREPLLSLLFSECKRSYTILYLISTPIFSIRPSISKVRLTFDLGYNMSQRKLRYRRFIYQSGIRTALHISSSSYDSIYRHMTTQTRHTTCYLI